MRYIEMSKKKSVAWIIVMTAFILAFSFWPVKASAQVPPATQPTFAPATLVDVAMPTNVTMNAFLACMAATGKEKTCRQLAEREASRSEKVAKEARKAVEPQGCSYWAGGCSAAYGGGGIYSSGVSYGVPAVVSGGTRVTSCGEGGCNVVYSSGGVTYGSRRW